MQEGEGKLRGTNTGSVTVRVLGSNTGSVKVRV